MQWTRRFFPVSEPRSGQEFIVRQRGRLAFTPLFLALVVIEGADVLFAVDSIPAVFGITRDAFLVYTSNICAIIGMRSFYFLIGGALPYFRYLDEGLVGGADIYRRQDAGGAAGYTCPRTCRWRW